MAGSFLLFLTLFDKLPYWQLQGDL